MFLDMWWSAQHPERIVSCGKDGLLVLHRMEQKQSPLSYACDVALDIAPDGLIGVASEYSVKISTILPSPLICVFSANSHIPIIKQQEHFLARKVSIICGHQHIFAVESSVEGMFLHLSECHTIRFEHQ